MRSSVIGMLTFLLVGCASVGHNFNETNLGKLQPGITTEAEAIELLGSQPTARVYNGDGTYIATWQYVHAVYVTVTQNKLVNLMFDRQKKLIRIVSTVNVAP